MINAEKTCNKWQRQILEKNLRKTVSTIHDSTKVGIVKDLFWNGKKYFFETE